MSSSDTTQVSAYVPTDIWLRFIERMPQYGLMRKGKAIAAAMEFWLEKHPPKEIPATRRPSGKSAQSSAS